MKDRARLAPEDWGKWSRVVRGEEKVRLSRISREGWRELLPE
jgi:hypothetical protein